MEPRKKDGWPFWFAAGVIVVLIAVVAVFALPVLVMIPFLVYDLFFRFWRAG